MLRRLALFIPLLLTPAALFAQVSISASSITDARETPIVSAKLCFSPVDATEKDTGFRVGSTQVVPGAVCGTVTNGVLASGISLAPSAAGTYYHVWLASRSTNAVIRDYGMTPITGTSWSLDTYDPNTATLPVNTLSVGTVTTLPAGSNATATVTNGSDGMLLNVGVPQGQAGIGSDANCHSDGSGHLTCLKVSSQINNVLYLSQFGSLTAANSAAIAGGLPVCVDQAMTLSANTTLNGKWTWRCAGSKVLTRGSYTLTFTQMPDIGDEQAFDSAGTGTVTFQKYARAVRASWFGLTYDHTTDNTNAIQQAGNAAIASHVGLIIPGGQDNLFVASPLSFSGLLSFTGDGNWATYAGSTNAIGTCLTTNYTAGAFLTIGSVQGAEVGGFCVHYTTSTAGTTTAVALSLPSFRRGTVHNLWIDGAANGIDISLNNTSGFYSNSVHDITITNPTNIALNLNSSPEGATGNNYDNIYVNCGGLGPGSGTLTGATTIQNAVYVATSSEVKFRQLNVEWCNVANPVYLASDVSEAEFYGVHFEGDSPTNTTSGNGSTQGYFTVRGGSLLVEDLTVLDNKIYVSNVNSHWSIVEFPNNAGFATVRDVFWNANHGTAGSWIPVCNAYENGAASGAMCELGYVGGDQTMLVKAGWGNWTTSPYKDYLCGNGCGTTASIGGSSLANGACTSGTASVARALSTLQLVRVTPWAWPGDGFTYQGYVTSNGSGTVTVKVCNASGATATPTATQFTVKVE